MKTRGATHTPAVPAGVPGFLMRAVEGRWYRLAAELARNRRRCTEPGIHDLRVATRRLLAVLDLADAVLPGEVSSRSRRVLRRYLKSFSPLRDCHVRILLLRGLTRRFTVARPLLREAALLQKTLVRNAGRAIARFDAARLEREISGIVSALASLEDTPARAAAAGTVLAGVAAEKFIRVAAREKHLSPGDTKTIHRLRVAFKEFRYTMEALPPASGGAGRSRLKAMNAFQDSMGEIQDIEVLIAAVGRFALARGAAYPASVVNLQRHLAQRRLWLVNAFMKQTDAVAGFWSHPFFPAYPHSKGGRS
ncbi:MAG TPA: CHAD domain-containing protein [Bacteroidota bacterium]|nr:CHAD domain-containing protein [Bacteroidota bacterium]